MKRCLLLLIFAPVFNSIRAQQPITFTAVVAVDSTPKDQLFIRARQWFNETFKSSKSVLQINDKESGELSGKGNTTVILSYQSMGARSYPFDAEFFISVSVKDNKYKYEITNIKVTHKSGEFTFGILTDSKTCPTKWPMVRQSKMDEMWEAAKVGAANEFDGVIASLKRSMIVGKTDW